MKEFGYRSEKLRKMPNRIVLIDFHNWAGVGEKIEGSLRLRFKVIRLEKDSPEDIIREAFSRPASTLIIFIDPGSGDYKPEKSFWRFLEINRADRPKRIPWGLFWGSSIYRVVNLGHPPHIEEWLKERRDWFNTLTPLRMVGTEDLLHVEPSRKFKQKDVQFVGQPYSFPDECPPKGAPHKVIHISADNPAMKGTKKILQAFEKVDIKSEVVCGVPHNVVMERLEESTIAALTMTDFPYGIGYAGFEAIGCGCLVISKTPGVLKTPIIHAETVDEMASLISYYSTHDDEFENVRQSQFKWAREMFSYEAFADRIYNTIKEEVEKGWNP
jgi:hypothetical protein